jgi:hypothetical protein
MSLALSTSILPDHSPNNGRNCTTALRFIQILYQLILCSNIGAVRSRAALASNATRDGRFARMDTEKW